MRNAQLLSCEVSFGRVSAMASNLTFTYVMLSGACPTWLTGRLRISP